MTQAGVDAGLSESDARWLAARMMAGTASLALETNFPFDEMKKLTSVQVVDEEEIARIFREAAHRAKALADELESSLTR
jgi:pyrroline-5-carboxylate reductase